MDNKISSWQLAALLVLSRIFAEATRFPKKSFFFFAKSGRMHVRKKLKKSP